MQITLRHAIEGIGIAIRQHPHFRFHLMAAGGVLVAAYLFRITRGELLIIVFTINLVLISEMINTSIEEITNLITIKWAHQAKVAKDVAAGMVLLSAVSSVVVGLLIFIPYLVELVD